MKLRVRGSIDGKEVSFSLSGTPGDIPPLVGNDHLIPWGCSIHLYPEECRLEIPSRGLEAQLHQQHRHVGNGSGTTRHFYLKLGGVSLLTHSSKRSRHGCASRHRASLTGVLVRELLFCGLPMSLSATWNRGSLIDLVG